MMEITIIIFMSLKVFSTETVKKFRFYYFNYFIFESIESGFCLNFKPLYYEKLVKFYLK